MCKRLWFMLRVYSDRQASYWPLSYERTYKILQLVVPAQPEVMQSLPERSYGDEETPLMRAEARSKGHDSINSFPWLWVRNRVIPHCIIALICCELRSHSKDTHGYCCQQVQGIKDREQNIYNQNKTNPDEGSSIRWCRPFCYPPTITTWV